MIEKLRISESGVSVMMVPGVQARSSASLFKGGDKAAGPEVKRPFHWGRGSIGAGAFSSQVISLGGSENATKTAA
jgi:hypothetical protein